MLVLCFAIDTYKASSLKDHVQRILSYLSKTSSSLPRLSIVHINNTMCLEIHEPCLAVSNHHLRPLRAQTFCFHFPLKFRTMIYCLLLTHEERIPVFISRKDFPRRSERVRALKKPHEAHGPKVVWDKPPSLFPSILQVCRLIHLEACPLLYSLNTFRFDHPSALSAFRWRSDPKNAAAVKEFTIDVNYREFGDWVPYLFKEPSLLGRELSSTGDWPYVKFIKITLDWRIFYQPKYAAIIGVEGCGRNSELPFFIGFKLVLRLQKNLGSCYQYQYYFLSKMPNSGGQ